MYTRESMQIFIDEIVKFVTFASYVSLVSLVILVKMQEKEGESK
jgi:hypothetical protein